jgi:hypothetical protein
MVLAAIVHSPILAWTLATPPPDPAAGLGVSDQLQGAASLALGGLTAGLLTYGVVEHLRGTPASFAACLRVGLGRLLPTLGVGVVVALLVTIGLMLLAVPGLILMCVYWVAVPAAVIEHGETGSALARSAALTRGRRWAVFGLHLVFGVLLIAGLLVLWFAVFPGDVGSSPTRLQQVLEWLWGGVVFGSLLAVASAVGYHDLRMEKEGTSAEDLARVFE